VATPPPEAVTWDKISLQFIRIACIDETNGWFDTEKGSDEISVGGAVLDSDGNTSAVAPVDLGGSWDDRDVRDLVPARSITGYSMRGGRTFPRTLFVTLVLVERDGSGMQDIIDKVVAKIAEEAKTSLAALLGGLVGGAQEDPQARSSAWPSATPSTGSSTRSRGHGTTSPSSRRPSGRHPVAAGHVRRPQDESFGRRQVPRARRVRSPLPVAPQQDVLTRGPLSAARRRQALPRTGADRMSVYAPGRYCWSIQATCRGASGRYRPVDRPSVDTRRRTSSCRMPRSAAATQ
jgi:hypothetical protein